MNHMKARTASLPAFRFFSGILLLALSLGGNSDAHGSMFIFSDGNFADGTWDLSYVQHEGAGGSSELYLTGWGVPGPSLGVIMVIDAAPPGGRSGLLVFARCLEATHDPATQGAIQSLDFVVDTYLSWAFGDTIHCGPALRQGETVYLADPIEITDTLWLHHVLAGLSAADFSPVGHPELHPDFTAAGGLIEFGFYQRGWTYGDWTVCDADYDNWVLLLRCEEPTPVETTSWGRLKREYLR